MFAVTYVHKLDPIPSKGYQVFKTREEMEVFVQEASKIDEITSIKKWMAID